MDLKLKAIYFAVLMMTASLAGCVSQDDYDTAVEEHEDERAEDAALIEGLQNDLSMSEANANALQAQLESLNATIEQSEADLTALQAQHSAVESSLATAEANATNLGQMVTLLEDQLAMAYSAMDVLNNTMEEFTEQYNSTMANLSAQISVMSQSTSNLSAILNSTYAAYNSALSEVSSLQSQVSSLNSTLAAKNEELANLESTNIFVSSLIIDFDSIFGTDVGDAIANESFGLKQQIYLTMKACWFVSETQFTPWDWEGTGCNELWTLLEDDLPFEMMNQSNNEKESIRYLSRVLWNETTAAQPDENFARFVATFALQALWEVNVGWSENGLYTEDSTKCWETISVGGFYDDCESVFLAWDSYSETDSQTFLNAEEGFLVGTTTDNTYDAYFCQSDVKLTISQLYSTDVTIHIYNFGTTNETLIEPDQGTWTGAVYGDNGGGVAYSFSPDSSLEIKDWSDPDSVCA